eukprot:42546-Pleurochrysis_carterae.AAC.3
MQTSDSVTARPVVSSRSVGTIPCGFAASRPGDFQWYHQSCRSDALNSSSPLGARFSHPNACVGATEHARACGWRRERHCSRSRF